MKATLKLEDGREIAVDVSEETLKQIEKPAKKTGYEKVEDGELHYLVGDDGKVYEFSTHHTYDMDAYDRGNYYSDKTIAENNARADILMRKLRRFAVEHRKWELNWTNNTQAKYFILYDYYENKLNCDYFYGERHFGVFYFDSKETAEAAIEEFKDELIWYFTEYKDSL